MKTVKLKARRLKGFKKIVGLMGRKKAETVFFNTRWGIHTFGLRFDIDVVILNSSMKAEVLRENLSKNRIFIWNPAFKSILELPEGFIKNKKIKKGDKIEVEFL